MDIFDMYEALFEQALDEEEFHPDSGTFQTIQRQSYPTPQPEGNQSNSTGEAPVDGFEELIRSAQQHHDEQPQSPEITEDEEDSLQSQIKSSRA